jgi:hypothetical protein
LWSETVVYPSTWTATDITGASARAEFRDRSGNTLALTLTSGAGELTIYGTLGAVGVKLTREQAEALGPNKAMGKSGRYVFKLNVVLPSTDEDLVDTCFVEVEEWV